MIRITRRRHRWITLAGLLAFLCAQFAVASYACPPGTAPMPMGAAFRSMAQADAGPAAVASADAARCLAHCKSHAAAPDQPAPAALPVPLAAGLLVRPAAFLSALTPTRARGPVEGIRGSPSLAIRFCVFLT